MAKFNALGTYVQLSGSIASIILLENTDIDAAKINEILISTAPFDPTLTDDSTTDNYIHLVQYETIAYVLRQCEKPVEKYST